MGTAIAQQAARGDLGGALAQHIQPDATTELARAVGADYASTENWQPKEVVDGRLMTGQNPASAGPMAKELLAALRKSV